MSPVDPHEAAIMRQCQDGIRYANGSTTGRFCLKADMCRSGGRCHFVAQVERHIERAWALPIPGRVVWSRGFDAEPRTLSLFEVA